MDLHGGFSVSQCFCVVLCLRGLSSLLSLKRGVIFLAVRELAAEELVIEMVPGQNECDEEDRRDPADDFLEASQHENVALFDNLYEGEVLNGEAVQW